jgi:MFS family permease
VNTQNTPVHVKLWNADFWRLALANMLMTMAVYMLVPVFPLWLMAHGEASSIGWGMVSYGVGLFAMGGFCNYLVQRFRRNHVCVVSLLFMLACIALMYAVSRPGLLPLPVGVSFVVLRFFLGLTFGLAQMVILSTLVIDVCESFQRTEANYGTSWFARFAMSLGPVVSLLLYQFQGIGLVLLVAGICCLVSLLFIQMVSFPFKAPDDNVSTFSLDRFFLPDGCLLFVNLFLITTIVGLVFSTPLTPLFYAMLMFGFFLALLAEKYMFADADLKSETVTGLILIGAALLIMRHQSLSVHGLTAISPAIPPVFIGFAIGVIGSRFLLFFIKLSHHCQRGTSQSTFFLAWESGISCGLALGYTALSDCLFESGIAIAVVALLLYNFITHSWYMKHKNR